jgi:hypothetical protein
MATKSCSHCVTALHHHRDLPSRQEKYLSSIQLPRRGSAACINRGRSGRGALSTLDGVRARHPPRLTHTTTNAAVRIHSLARLSPFGLQCKALMRNAAPPWRDAVPRQQLRQDLYFRCCFYIIDCAWPLTCHLFLYCLQLSIKHHELLIVSSASPSCARAFAAARAPARHPDGCFTTHEPCVDETRRRETRAPLTRSSLTSVLIRGSTQDLACGQRQHQLQDMTHHVLRCVHQGRR